METILKPNKTNERILKTIKKAIRNESISWQELITLNDLKYYIMLFHSDDLELCEWAGIDESELIRKG